MTLTIPCREQAEYTCQLLGIAGPKSRTGSKVVAFSLCQNHSGLYDQIDRELVEEGWPRAYIGAAERMF
ncbi:MAG TPA: hypothetical protein VGV89_06965 [Thermoplasmata archaeon]|nr:hypothetical protein [Thermoplasmata archaeon]